MSIFDRIKKLGKTKPPRLQTEGVKFYDSLGALSGSNSRYAVEINDFDDSEITRALGIIPKAKLPVWYVQAPYGHPRTDPIEDYRNLCQMGVVQRCIRLYIQKIMATPWNINAKDPTVDLARLKGKIDSIIHWFKNASTNETSFFQELERALWDYFEIGEGVLVKMFTTKSYTLVKGQKVILSSVPPGNLVYVQSYESSQFQVFATDYNNIMGHWQFNFVKSPPQFFTPRELIVLQDQPYNLRFYGRPRVASIRQFLEQIANQMLQMRNFYVKGGTLQGIISTSGASVKEEARIEKFFQEKFRSMEHKLAVLQGGKDFKTEFLPLMLNVKDLAFLEGFEFIQKFVMSVFDIMPEELLGSENSKAGVAESSRKQRARIRAMLNTLEFHINKEIMRELDPEDELIFEYEKDTEPEVQRIMQETHGSQLDRGQITLNEWRKLMGLPTYDDDRANQPLPFLEIDIAKENAERMAANFAANDPKGMEGEEDSDTKPPTNTEDDNKKEPDVRPDKPLDDKKKAYAGQTYLDGKAILKALSEAEIDAQLDKILSRLSVGMERQLLEVFKLWTDRLGELDLATLDTNLINDLIDRIIIQNELTSSITENMFEAFRTGLNLDDEFQIAANPIFGLPDRKTIEYFRTYPLLVAKSTTDKISNKLSQELIEGVNRGESIPKLRKRIQSVMGDLSKNQAEMIARTETTNAMTWGQINAMRQSGIEKWEFYTSLDSRVCPICAPLHGKQFNIDDVEHKPPKHPNCRCTVLAVIPEEITKSGWFPTAKMGELELASGESIVKMLSTRVKANQSTREIAKDWNTTHQTVNNWIKKFDLR